MIALVDANAIFAHALFFFHYSIAINVSVGYTQGSKEDPTYEEVCSGSTGHTEATMIIYDPSIVSYDRLVHLAMDRLGESKYLVNQVGNDM